MSETQPTTEPMPIPEPPRRPPPFVVSASMRPWVMYAILLANIGVFVAKWILGPAGEDWIFRQFSHNKYEVAHGELWRLWTSTYLHPVLIHLGFNMLVHVQMGSVIERILGHWRYFVLYTLSGLGGAFLFQAMGTEGEGMGASGAIYGVAGAYVLAALARTPDGDIRPNRKLVWMCAFFIIGDQVFAYAWELANGVMRIALSAHVGGLLSGLLLGYALIPRPPQVASRVKHRCWIAGVVFGLLCLATAWYGIAVLEHPDPQLGPMRWARAERAKLGELVKEIDAGKLEAAVSLWRTLQIGEEPLKRTVGYELFDGLMANSNEALAREVLDELIQSAEAELVARRKEEPKDPARGPSHELFNEVAWMHALRGTSLDAALQLVDEALARLDAERQGIWRHLPRSRESTVRESMYLNTRGWLHLRRGDVKEAIEDLEGATRIAPLGANFLYLALAHHRLGNTKQAREAGRSTDSVKDQLTHYEQKLLEELRDSLGGF